MSHICLKVWPIMGQSPKCVTSRVLVRMTGNLTKAEPKRLFFLSQKNLSLLQHLDLKLCWPFNLVNYAKLGSGRSKECSPEDADPNKMIVFDAIKLPQVVQILSPTLKLLNGDDRKRRFPWQCVHTWLHPSSHHVVPVWVMLCSCLFD